MEPEITVGERVVRQHPDAAVWVERLVPLVYDDLRKMASRQLRRLRPGRTLGTTALVHEAYAELAAREDREFVDEEHFLAVTATIMRHLLVDEVRRRNSAKKGGGVAAVTLGTSDLASETRPVDLLALDQALDELGRLDARLVRLVELRYFAGLTVAETAEALDVSERTVKRDWRKSRALLATFLTPAE